MGAKLLTIKEAAFNISESYLAAKANYNSAINAQAPDADLFLALEQCIKIGEQYKLALNKLLIALHADEEKGEVIERVKKFKGLLEEELIDYAAKKDDWRRTEQAKNE